jgi:hypothetical protein
LKGQRPLGAKPPAKNWNTFIILIIQYYQANKQTNKQNEYYQSFNRHFTRWLWSNFGGV